MAQHSQPLIPLTFDGLVEGFISHVTALWDECADQNSYLYAQKQSLAVATANYIYISCLPLFQTFDSSLELYQLIGQEFYQ